MTPAEDRAVWVLRQLKQHGLKLTLPRLAIVRCLAGARAPVSIRHLAVSPGIREQCDPATIYRTLMCLVELRVARELRLTNRSSHFVLTPLGAAHDYLICEGCGRITELPCEGELHDLEKRFAKNHGFEARRHQFEVYGICDLCRAESKRASEPNSGCVCCQPSFLAT